MKLHDLSLTQQEKDERKPMEVTSEPDSGPEYPSGLRITLDDSSIEKMTGIDKKDIDSTFEMRAKVRVVGKSSEQRNGKSEKRMELQIIEAGIGKTETDFTEGFEEGDKDGDQPYFDTRKKSRP